MFLPPLPPLLALVSFWKIFTATKKKAICTAFYRYAKFLVRLPLWHSNGDICRKCKVSKPSMAIERRISPHRAKESLQIQYQCFKSQLPLDYCHFIIFVVEVYLNFCSFLSFLLFTPSFPFLTGNKLIIKIIIKDKKQKRYIISSERKSQKIFYSKICLLLILTKLLDW